MNQSLCGHWKGYPLICCPSETKETTTTSLSVEYGESCRTPERRRGSCIRVAQCSRFAHIVGKENIPQSTVAILNESYCGTYGKVPLICCPTDSTPTTTTSTSTTPVSTTVAYNGICWTPNAVKGKCIKVRDCPQFAEALIREPESESIQEALNESFCGIRRKHKLVCCPDDVKITQTTPAEPVIEAIETGLSCQTPTGETGTCMSEIDCPGRHVDSLLHNSQPTSNRKSFCGVKDGARLICCPPASDHAKTEDTCKTPSGEDGKCISLDECSALSSLVDPKRLTKHTLEQLRKLHCGPLDNDNMYCCSSSTADNDEKQHRNLYLLDQNSCGKSPLFRVLEDRSEIGKKAKLSTIPWMALIAYNSGKYSLKDLWNSMKPIKVKEPFTVEVQVQFEELKQLRKCNFECSGANIKDIQLFPDISSFN
ncbi:hypothetical protein J437_LFUL016742 [Ladona fulva]|uniref:Clip domain-containing protein n=1 Tax=Ladona fulva TaxID=123851 RepID=A0A8K0KJK2_LADFU|nr:hypothetical protein J437_LFUL016742 [Ladona fulva]